MLTESMYKLKLVILKSVSLSVGIAILLQNVVNVEKKTPNHPSEQQNSLLFPVPLRMHNRNCDGRAWDGFGFRSGTLVGGIDDENGKRRGWDLLWLLSQQTTKVRAASSTNSMACHSRENVQYNGCDPRPPPTPSQITCKGLQHNVWHLIHLYTKYTYILTFL